MKYPKGYKSAPDYTKIAVSFPDQLFKDIMALAKKDKQTFNVTVLSLIRCGKICIDESDKFEPTGEPNDTEKLAD